MSESIHVSVIAAIYNAEKTLHRCLNALKAQTIRNAEFILVDDGSTDGTAGICDDFARSDPRFKVFHKQNEGVSATRQFGLDHARGDYIIYVDADDFMDKDMYSDFYREAVRTGADLVCSDFYRFHGDGTEVLIKDNVRSWTHKDVLDAIIYRSYGALWSRMVRRSLIERYCIRFPERMQYMEDKLFWVQLLSRSYRNGDNLAIRHLPKAYYHYDVSVNPESLSRIPARTKLEWRMTYCRNIAGELDLSVFGRSFHDLVVSYGFNALWNRTLLPDGFLTVFGNYSDGIRRQATPGVRKHLVLLAAEGNYQKAWKRRWIAIPLLLKERCLSKQ